MVQFLLKFRKFLSHNPYIIIFSLLALFIFLRLLYLPESFGFGSDAGRDYLRIWELIQNREFTLIGPPSQYSARGMQFFFGPAPYYVLAPALVLVNWEPLRSAYYLIFVNASALLISAIFLQKAKQRKFLIYTFVLLNVITPILIQYSRVYWNPYLMLPISTVTACLLVFISHKKIPSVWWFLVLGILGGIGLQMHYSFVITMIVSIVWLLVVKKLSLYFLVWYVAGFILGFCPIIAFELRNNYHNTRAIFAYLQNANTVASTFNFSHYYFVSLAPFNLLFVAWLTAKLKNMFFAAAYAMLILYVFFSFRIMLVPPIQAFDMQENWNYSDLKTTSMIITSDDPQNFNIVDQLTGDNRAMALRYLLTINGFQPNGVESYANSKILYIYSKQPLEFLLENPAYELQNADKFSLESSWTINDEVTLYKLVK